MRHWLSTTVAKQLERPPPPPGGRSGREQMTCIVVTGQGERASERAAPVMERDQRCYNLTVGRRLQGVKHRHHVFLSVSFFNLDSPDASASWQTRKAGPVEQPHDSKATYSSNTPVTPCRKIPTVTHSSHAPTEVSKCSAFQPDRRDDGRGAKSVFFLMKMIFSYFLSQRWSRFFSL